MKKYAALTGMVLAALVVMLYVFPVISYEAEVPTNYMEAIERQSKGVCSHTLPLVPVYVSVEDYAEGEVHYTIHYFPFGTVGMTFIEGDGYNIEKPLTGL